MTPFGTGFPNASIARRPAVTLALAALVVFATAYGGIEFTRGTARVAAIWPANAALLVIMLSLGAGRARMLGLAAAGYLGFAAANFAAGDGLAICLGLPVANLVEVMICRAALMRFGDHDLTRPRAFAMFCAVAAGPASLASSLTAVALFAVVAPSTALSSLFWDWYAADALGLVTFTPLFWSIATRSVEISRKRLPAAALTAAAFCALLAAIFVQSTYPVLFLVYPALIVVAFQFGFGGAAVALVVTATVAVVATSNGHGPLSLMRGTLREQIAILQIFVAVSAAMSLAVASVLAEREKLNRQLRAAKTAAEAAEDRLRESEARYRLLAENSSDVIALSGADGQVDYVSPSVAELLGYPPETFASLGLGALLHPQERQGLLESLRELGPERPNLTKVLRLRGAAGGWLWVEGAFAFVPDARGAKTLAVLRDVGERKAYEAELEDARRAAEDALRVRSEFLATMSHELRTPLNGILGFSELLIESGELRSAEGLRYARHVETSSRALLAIVNDLMDVSRLEAGAVELDPQPFSLRELVEGCAAMLRREADRKGLALVVEVADDAPDRLVGDDARLRQVLINLLSNAVKFTDAGSVTLRASCAADGEAAAVLCVVVEDTGIGVPDDKRDRLFKRFSQVDQTTSRRYGGAGLGLSICKSLADLMGADISLASREGEGSVFTLSVRLALGAPEPLRGTTPRLALAAAPSRRGHVAEARPAEPSARTLAADDPELLHQPTLDELVAFLGDAPGGAFLDRLSDQMSAAFRAPPRSRENLPELRYEALALASTSGMLGFHRLQAACLSLEIAIDRGRGEITADALLAFAQARLARDASGPALAAARAAPPLRAAG